MQNNQRPAPLPRYVRLHAEAMAILERQFGGVLHQPDLAERWHVNQASVSRWLRGKVRMRYEDAQDLAQMAGLPLSDLVQAPLAGMPRARVTEVGPSGVVVELPQSAGHADTASRGTILSPSPKPLPIAQDVTYPIVGATGIAGIIVVLRLRPSDMHGGRQGEHADMSDTAQYVAVFIDRPPVTALEAVRITGRCMEPEIRQGDVVIVDTSRRWDAQDGDVVAAVLTANQERVVRRLYKAEQSVRLVADAPGYDPIEVPGDQIEVLGVVTHSSHVVQRRRPLRLNGHLSA